MALEQNLQEPTAQYECDGDISLKQKWKSISASAPSVETADSCFDCNICLDSAHDPVVTLCGHLFCWPCIYKWLHVQNSAPDADHQQKCPVCKTNVSSDSLVPLYGRGNPSSRVKRPNLGLVVPRRPKASGLHTLVTSSTTTTSGNTNPHFAHPYGGHSTPGSPTLGGMAMPNVLSPTAGMFGGMVYARIFGSPDSSLFTYPYPNPYGITGSSGVSPRMRRRELQADKSLSRVTLFLFCCFVLCLLLF